MRTFSWSGVDYYSIDLSKDGDSKPPAASCDVRWAIRPCSKRRARTSAGGVFGLISGLIPERSALSASGGRAFGYAGPDVIGPARSAVRRPRKRVRPAIGLDAPDSRVRKRRQRPITESSAQPRRTLTVVRKESQVASSLWSDANGGVPRGGGLSFGLSCPRSSAFAGARLALHTAGKATSEPAWISICRLGKRVGFTPSRVRIPHPPPRAAIDVSASTRNDDRLALKRP
jgi:hypothetical protein